MPFRPLPLPHILLQSPILLANVARSLNPLDQDSAALLRIVGRHLAAQGGLPQALSELVPEIASARARSRRAARRRLAGILAGVLAGATEANAIESDATWPLQLYELCDRAKNGFRVSLLLTFFQEALQLEGDLLASAGYLQVILHHVAKQQDDLAGPDMTKSIVGWAQRQPMALAGLARTRHKSLTPLGDVLATQLAKDNTDAVPLEPSAQGWLAMAAILPSGALSAQLASRIALPLLVAKATEMDGVAAWQRAVMCAAQAGPALDAIVEEIDVATLAAGCGALSFTLASRHCCIKRLVQRCTEDDLRRLWSARYEAQGPAWLDVARGAIASWGSGGRLERGFGTRDGKAEW